MNKKLWEQYADWKENYRFVDLTHELSPETPHWAGFPAMDVLRLFDYPVGFRTHEFRLVSQYGTHVDAPVHFIPGGRELQDIAVEEMILPLCVIDVSAKVADNWDYVTTVEDIQEWEKTYGEIPAGSFVAVRTDWSKREDMNNYDDEGNRHYPGWSMEALKYLVSLVNDVLDMNKLQSGDLKDQQLLFDLTIVLRELNQIYDERAAKKGIRYEIDWKSTYSHSALVGNPVYLGRILSNIMDNAIKFSQAGSVITVWVEEETLDDGRAIFTFYCKDQGVGMSEDFIAHAFDMFSQERKTSRSRYEGTGLGLAITKQLVDRMDGSIELKSKAGVGATVIVKIPFKIGTQDKNSNLSDKPVSLDDYSVEGMRALVVEDNELNMEISRCILEDSGMEVTCAVDGQEAVEIFEKSAPDYFGVIYMDIMMPRVNGLDAARTIREMKRRDARRVPIIAMSANAFAEDIINSRLAGMNVHLAKPLDAEKMIAALKQCMADNSDVKLHEDL